MLIYILDKKVTSTLNKLLNELYLSDDYLEAKYTQVWKDAHSKELVNKILNVQSDVLNLIHSLNAMSVR